MVYLFFDRIGRKYLHTQEADEEFRAHACHEGEPEHVHGGRRLTMPDYTPQPGDSTPRDHQRPGDAAKASGREQDRGGDWAPDDRQKPGDQKEVDEAFKEEQEPVGGVHFSAPFIKRPVATFLLSIAIILAGSVAYKLLPVSSLPQVEYPVISVGAQFAGRGPGDDGELRSPRRSSASSRASRASTR